MREHLEHLRMEAIRASGMRPLMVAVAWQAVRDAAGWDRCGTADAARAMAFILGDACRIYASRSVRTTGPC